MSIHLFVAAEGWDIAQLVSATRAGSNVVYSALIPWVFLAAFGMLVFEAYKVFQGSTASMTGALLRIAIAVGLLTNFHDWTGEIGNAINGTVQTIGNGGGQDQLMADYAAILQNPGKNDQSSNVPFWDFIAKAGASVGDQMMRVMLWVLGAVAYAVYWVDAVTAIISVIDDDRGRSGLYRSVDDDGNEGYRDAIFFDVDEHRVVAAWLGVRKYRYKANACGGGEQR